MVAATGVMLATGLVLVPPVIALFAATEAAGVFADVVVAIAASPSPVLLADVTIPAEGLATAGSAVLGGSAAVWVRAAVSVIGRGEENSLTGACEALLCPPRE